MSAFWPASTKVLVIGGGISGLVCAWKLQQLGVPVLLIERGPRFGGVIATVENGFCFDVGPQSFTTTPALIALIAELGIARELLRADARAPRYILHRGRLVPAPLAPPKLLRTPLIGFSTRLRIVADLLGRSRPPSGDETVAAFVRRKFGDDVLNNLVAPFVSGVYAGDPEKLSLASAFPAARKMEEQFGSVVRGAIKLRRQSGGTHTTQANFRQGMSTLIDALAAKLGDAARCGCELTSIRRTESSGAARFKVSCSDGHANQTFQAAAIVVATPAYDAASLLAEIDPRFPAAFKKIDYAGIAQVSAAYPLDRIQYRSPRSNAGIAPTPLDGFGFLVPRSEGLRLLGSIWNSSLFPERFTAHPKIAVFTSFLGGATDPEIYSWPEAKIANTAHAELSRVLGISATPIEQHVTRWQRALPQYNVGHAQIVENLTALCVAMRGVFLAGNYLTGPSLGACVEQATQTAEAAAHVAGRPA